MGITRKRGGAASQVNDRSDIEKLYEVSLKTKGNVGKNKTDINDGILVSQLMGHLKSTRSDSFLLKCQAIAGFKIDNFDQLKEGKNGHPSKIYERLGKTASENLVVATEVGEIGGNYSGLEVMMSGIRNGMVDAPDVNITIKGNVGSEFDDNVFIYKGFTDKHTLLNFKAIEPGSTQSVQDLSQPTLHTLHKIHTKAGDTKALDSLSNFKYINSNGVKILNLHLPSVGPNGNSIDDFLKAYLPTIEELLGEIPDVIAGDSNITIEKCKNPKLDREQIMREMVGAVSTKYKVTGFSWALLMSTTSVDKERDGGILINQQALKKKSGC
jgi:hypothetical protein